MIKSLLLTILVIILVGAIILLVSTLFAMIGDTARGQDFVVYWDHVPIAEGWQGAGEPADSYFVYERIAATPDSFYCVWTDGDLRGWRVSAYAEWGDWDYESPLSSIETLGGEANLRHEDRSADTISICLNVIIPDSKGEWEVHATPDSIVFVWASVWDMNGVGDSIDVSDLTFFGEGYGDGTFDLSDFTFFGVDYGRERRKAVVFK